MAPGCVGEFPLIRSPDNSLHSASATTTNTHLLDGLLHASNRDVWQGYVSRYRPMIVGFSRRLGLSAEDAEDTAQQTLIAFADSYRAGKYQRDKGRLRTWLFGIARNQALNCRKRNARRRPRTATPEELDDLGQDDGLHAVWEREWRDAVLRACLEEVRGEVKPTTFEAFRLFALEGVEAERVGEQLGITANAVFGAKRRVVRRVRELLPQMMEHW